MHLGYDPSFLSVVVPLPDARRPSVALDYPRFSVVLDTARRMAAVTGVNIDGAAVDDLERAGVWHFDDRVPETAQTGPEVYRANALDRGHLVRRRDPGWGERSDALTATAATFVYTNAAPQASEFNQSKELWLGLEDHVLQYADAEDLRISVFTAPVLEQGDPPYRGILVPLRFWKVAAWVDPGRGLAAAGFVLDQSGLVRVADRTAEVAPLTPFKTFQVPIADIAARAGVDLGGLVAADVRPGEALRAGEAWHPLVAPGDIVLRPG